MAWQALDPLGPWFQLMNFFFLFAALFEKDVLLIRWALVLAYTCLIMNAFSGLLVWKQGFWGSGPRYIAVDGMVWGLFIGFFHYRAMFLLLRDQRKIKFKSPDEQAVANFLYRVGGMQKWEAHKSLKAGKFVKVSKDETIDTGSDNLILIIDGKVRYEAFSGNANTSSGELLSGDFLNLHVLNATASPAGMFDIETRVSAISGCLLYVWSAESLLALTSSGNPAMATAWERIGYYAIAARCNRLLRGTKAWANGLLSDVKENDEWWDGGRARDFRSLEPQENPNAGGLGNYLRWIWNSLTPTPIPGLRHLGPNNAGLNCQQRLFASRSKAMSSGEELFQTNLDIGDDKGVTSKTALEKC